MNKLSSISVCLLVVAAKALTAVPSDPAATPRTVNMGTAEVKSQTTSTVRIGIVAAGTLARIAPVTQGVLNRDYTNAGGGTCRVGAYYAANSTCTVEVAFKPEHPGAIYGAVNLLNKSGDTVGSVYLQGTGVGPQISFYPARQTVVVGSFAAAPALSVDTVGNIYIAQPETYGGYPVDGGAYKETLTDAGKYTESSLGSYVDPEGIAVDGGGNVYVADTVISGWKVTQPQTGHDQQTLGHFSGSSVAVDAAGNLYSTFNTTSIYKQTLQADGSYTRSKIASGFLYPTGVAVDAHGNVFVTDLGGANKEGVPYGAGLYKETPQADGKYLQTWIGSRWVGPTSVAVDGNGVLYVNDSGTVYAETPIEGGKYRRSTVTSGLPTYGGVAVDGSGNLYVPVYAGQGEYGPTYSINKLDRSQAPAIAFADTSAGVYSTDSPRIVTITNSSETPLNFSEVRYPANFPESNTGVRDCTASTSLAKGESCTLSITFEPKASSIANSAALLSGNVTITTNSGKGGATQQSIAVSGKATPRIGTAPVFSVSGGEYHGSKTVAIRSAIEGATIYYALHGATPTTASPKYTGPITISSSETIRAIAVAPGYAVSPMASATYTIMPR